MKALLVNSITIIHLFICIFLGAGGYIIPPEYIPIYLLCLPYLVIDKNDIDRKCWLTKVLNMINNTSNDEEENDFLYSLTKEYGFNIQYNMFTFIIYIILILNWLYAYYRLMNQYKIKLFPNETTQYLVYSLVLIWIIVLFI
tara:strand:- start:276 stop:701 length:426 start_codon:yes stop_codon:yes gene_type:complete